MKIRVPSKWSTSHANVLSLILILFTNGIIIAFGQIKFTDYCRSMEGELGKCVTLNQCPMFFDWIYERPLVKKNIKLVVKFTCYFDLFQPKVCCPLSQINLEGNYLEEYSPSEPQPTQADDFDFQMTSISPKPFKSTFKNAQLDELTFQDTSAFPSTPKPAQVDLIFPGDNQYELKKKSKTKLFEKFNLLPSIKECSNSVKLDRLIGSYGTQPWIVILGYKDKLTRRFENLCAGTIINNRYILTSARCLYETNNKLTHVRVGEFNLDTQIDQGSPYLPSSTYKEYKIIQVIPNLNYNRNQHSSDIALLRVSQDIDFSSIFVKPVCLPFFKEYGIPDVPDLDDLTTLMEKKALVPGWGKTTWRSNPGSKILQETPVQFCPNEECRAIYGNEFSMKKSKQFCIKGSHQDNSCIEGDAGGPLLLPLPLNSIKAGGFNTPKMFQLGILSHGPMECNNNNATSIPVLPSIFTKVHNYLDWILSSIEP